MILLGDPSVDHSPVLVNVSDRFDAREQATDILIHFIHPTKTAW